MLASLDNIKYYEKNETPNCPCNPANNLQQ